MTPLIQPGDHLNNDAARYAEIQQQWLELIERGVVDSPELQALWAESEKIKNRHGGMPPK